MGNQPSRTRPPDTNEGSPHHSRTGSSRTSHPQSGRFHPSGSSSRGRATGGGGGGESYYSFSGPEPCRTTTPTNHQSTSTNVPRTPHLRPHFSPPVSPQESTNSYGEFDVHRSYFLSPSSTARSKIVMGNSHSNEQLPEAREARRRDRRSERGSSGFDATSSPVQVPTGGSGNAHRREHSAQYDRQDPSVQPVGSGDYALKSNLNFPPRLPLPIQEELYTPGSPIITPDDLSQDLRDDSAEGVTLPHQASLLSHTTADDEEDSVEHEPESNRGRTVPTVIRWKPDAKAEPKLDIRDYKVYITGSFTNWEKKYRMHRDPKNPGSLSTKLDLLPGTHHVKFIVNGEMQLSSDLPTAVDFTNILMNYVEVSADDIPPDAHDQSAQPDGSHSPPAQAPGVEQHDFAAHPVEADVDAKDPAATTSTEESEKRYLPTTSAHYSDEIPLYLPDLDRDEGSNRFRRSANHLRDIPTPPSLPLFLGKSILNGITPMKDDSSVLNMPNHTVLNHLTTSSIKNDVLATSLTTRYKRKYVTTIIYRPTREED